MPTIKGSIKTSNNDTINKVVKQFENFDIEVGIPSNAINYPDGTRVAEVAVTNEFGDPDKGIPERSFLRSTVREERPKYKSLMVKAIESSEKNKTPILKRASEIGQVAESDVKRKITDIKTPPNSPRTINEKKSSNPLVDTGHLRNSIRYEVIER